MQIVYIQYLFLRNKHKFSRVIFCEGRDGQGEHFRGDEIFQGNFQVEILHEREGNFHAKFRKLSQIKLRKQAS